MEWGVEPTTDLCIRSSMYVICILCIDKYMHIFGRNMCDLLYLLVVDGHLSARALSYDPNLNTSQDCMQDLPRRRASHNARCTLHPPETLT